MMDRMERQWISIYYGLPCATSAHGDSNFLSSSFARHAWISVSNPTATDCRPGSQIATFDELVSQAGVETYPRKNADVFRLVDRNLQQHRSAAQSQLSPLVTGQS
jgi:hypothetical protein